MVTNEKSQLVDHLMYFPFGEVWLEGAACVFAGGLFLHREEFDPDCRSPFEAKNTSQHNWNVKLWGYAKPLARKGSNSAAGWSQ